MRLREIIVSGWCQLARWRFFFDWGLAVDVEPINVYIDAADPNVGFANWQGVTPSAATGAYDSYGSAGTTIVNAFSSAIIGPFPWSPGAGGHKCLLGPTRNSRKPSTGGPEVTVLRAGNSELRRTRRCP